MIRRDDALDFFRCKGVSLNLIRAIAEITFLFFFCVGVAQSHEDLEYKIKAAYLYNFTKFISWPEINTDTFNICIVGSDPIEDLLDSLESKTAFGKPIRIVHRIRSSHVADCHIVYFGATTSRADIANFSFVGNLTVSSLPKFAEFGGMIGFVLENQKVKLHINLKAIKKGDLGVSAKLIEVSTLVEGDEHE